MLNLKIHMNVMEAMLFFWQSVVEREKVSENYIVDIASMPEMIKIYDEEFDQESVRRALSSISNREPFTPRNKKEGRFWNNNMWMTEDLEICKSMINPIKILNLEGLQKELDECFEEELHIYFLPMHLDIYKKDKKEIFINFFRLQPDLFEENILKIDEKELVDFIKQKILE